jgi:hypothetical protein
MAALSFATWAQRRAGAGSKPAEHHGPGDGRGGLPAVARTSRRDGVRGDSPDRRGARPFRVALRVGASVIAVHAVVVALVLHGGSSIRDFPDLGSKFSTQSLASPYLGVHDPAYLAHPPRHAGGFDGQFAYYIAVDPIHATGYMDYPFIRYQRVLYPALAHLVSLGQPRAVPAALVVVNIAAAAAGAGVLAFYLATRGSAPWLALLYGLGPGAVSVVLNDLSECVEWSLIAAGLVVYLLGGRRKILVPGALFGLSVLTKDNGLAVIVPLIGYDLLIGRWLLPIREELQVRAGRALVWGGTVFLPYLGWSLLMKVWIGQPPVASYLGARLPSSAAGVLALGRRGDVLEGLMFVLPAVITFALGVWALARGRREIQVLLLLVAPVVYSFLLGPAWYGSSVDLARLGIGITVVALVAYPELRAVTAQRLLMAYGTVLTFPAVLFLTYISLFTLRK